MEDQMKITRIFLSIFLFFLYSEFAFAQDQLVIIFQDGTSQRVTLSKPAYSIKSINLNGASSTSGSGRIAVVAGTYGKNCGTVYGNKTEYLARACNDKRHCDYVIDYKIIGDPAVGCSKDYIAEWHCGNDQTSRTALASPEAGFGKKITLTCPP
jgi:hypothetical protein